MKQLRVGIIGLNFMGKAHSNAWLNVGKFFDLGAEVVMQAACDIDKKLARSFARNWGWKSVETDWRKLISRDDVDIVDITAPNNLHAEMAIGALRAGKHVSCEKPLALNLKEAKRMVAVAKKSGKKNTVWFCYRRTPALSLAKQIVEEGRLGRIYHVRALYLQDWIMDPSFPLVWRLKKELAGSGAHGDINAHIVDATRFLVGEFDSVTAAMFTFIKQRPKLKATGLGLTAKASKKKGRVTVDDAVAAIAKLKNGALATFEATRFGRGHRNGNSIEINGDKGSLRFFFERMNELYFYDQTDPKHLQGWRTISATEPVHPYMEAWWPAGHGIGYEHTFVNQAADFVRGILKNRKTEPGFKSATQTQAVLEAMSKSAESGRWVKVQTV